MQAYIPMSAKAVYKSRGHTGQRGFTLIELMVAMVISLFLIGGVVLMYSSTKAAYVDSNQLSRMQENIRFASDYLVRDIRNAGFRDQLTLVAIEQLTVQQKVAEIIDSGTDGIADELVIRYAGRGHCQDSFDDYRVVENRYFLDDDTGELRCDGGYYQDTDGDGDLEYVAAAQAPQALVAGLTDLAFSLDMADGSTQGGDYVCRELNTNVAPSTRCQAVRIGLEFEGLRDLDDPGQFEQRFIELTSTLRNAAIDKIYATCSRLELRAGVTPGTWC